MTMPKKRKEPTLYAVKRPDGTLMTSTVEYGKLYSWSAAWDTEEIDTSGYDFGLTTAGFAAIARKLGYRVVKVKIVEVE